MNPALVHPQNCKPPWTPLRSKLRFPKIVGCPEPYIRHAAKGLPYACACSLMAEYQP